eukprot:scaffold647911_cov42-Prasinocladus_malaysianus.AAC.1
MSNSIKNTCICPYTHRSGHPGISYLCYANWVANLFVSCGDEPPEEPVATQEADLVAVYLEHVQGNPPHGPPGTVVDMFRAAQTVGTGPAGRPQVVLRALADHLAQGHASADLQMVEAHIHPLHGAVEDDAVRHVGAADVPDGVVAEVQAQQGRMHPYGLPQGLAALGPDA